MVGPVNSSDGSSQIGFGGIISPSSGNNGGHAPRISLFDSFSPFLQQSNHNPMNLFQMFGFGLQNLFFNNPLMRFAGNYFPWLQTFQRPTNPNVGSAETGRLLLNFSIANPSSVERMMRRSTTPAVTPEVEDECIQPPYVPEGSTPSTPSATTGTVREIDVGMTFFPVRARLLTLANYIDNIFEHQRRGNVTLSHDEVQQLTTLRNNAADLGSTWNTIPATQRNALVSLLQTTVTNLRGAGGVLNRPQIMNCARTLYYTAGGTTHESTHPNQFAEFSGLLHGDSLLHALEGIRVPE